MATGRWFGSSEGSEQPPGQSFAAHNHSYHQRQQAFTSKAQNNAFEHLRQIQVKPAPADQRPMALTLEPIE